MSTLDGTARGGNGRGADWRSATTTERRRPWSGVGAVGAVGIAYSASWIIGLCSWPANPAVTLNADGVTSAFAAHSGIAAVQYTFTEGLPAAGLAVVAVALSRAAAGAASDGQAGGRPGPLSRLVLTAGVLAAAVSTVQWVLGLVLATVAAPHGEHAASLTLFQIVNRLDGVKMFLLAGLAAGGTALARRAVLPRWLGVSGTVLAVLLLGSGVGYLLLNPTLAPLAYVDGPLLLFWVTGTAVVSGRRRRA